MPRLLRKDTIRLLEASCDSLSLANIGLAIPRKAGQFRCAPELGLIGTAAEQAMSACLVESYGLAILQKDAPQGSDTRTFKSARQILADFRKMLRSPVPSAAFLTQGTVVPEEHRQRILELTDRFNLLIQLRAGGLHAGMGSRIDLAMAMADEVARFLITLSLASKIKPYLANVPQPSVAPKARVTLVEDLVREIKENSAKNNISSLLTAAFLVLPDVPSQEPGWLAALERVQVAVNKDDVLFLVDILSRAVPITLVRQSDGGSSLPVKVQPDNPGALPISFQYLRTSFTKLKDQWHAYVGLANGRLDAGVLDLPPTDFVLDLFAVGFEKVGLTADEEIKLPHTQTWPFIAASLEARGTAFPYWFLVRRTDNLSQLKSYLNRAAGFSKAELRSRVGEATQGIQSFLNSTPLALNNPLRISMEKAKAVVNAKYSQLPELVRKNRGGDRDPGFELEKHILAITSNDAVIEPVLSNLIANTYKLSDSSRLYWSQKVAEAADQEADVTALLALLRSRELERCSTSARKELRLIDFWYSGPNIE